MELRLRLAQTLATLTLLTAVGTGPVSALYYVRGPDNAPAALMAATWFTVALASGLWTLALVLGLLLVKDRTHKLLYAQRMLFWMAGAGVAFLAIEGILDDVTNLLVGVAIYWIIGGSMGILMEPLRSLAAPPSPITPPRTSTGQSHLGAHPQASTHTRARGHKDAGAGKDRVRE